MNLTNFLQKFKNLKKLLLLFFVATSVTSCGEKGCNEAGEFYVKVYELHANPKSFANSSNKIMSYGGYGEKPQSIDFLDTGLLYNGGRITVAITGEWSSSAPNSTQANISEMDHCDICIKDRTTTGATPDLHNNQCYCGPKIDSNGVLTYTESKNTRSKEDGSVNSGYTPGACVDPLEGDTCSCVRRPSLSDIPSLVAYSLGSSTKKLTASGTGYTQTSNPNNKICKLSMGLGAYLKIIPGEASNPARTIDSTKVVYHMFSTTQFCPIKRNRSFCKDEKGIVRTKYIWNSPLPIPTNPEKTEFSQDLDKIQVGLYDHFYHDNSGSYKIEFVGGVILKDGDGIFAGSVKLAEDFLFGSNDYNESLKRREKIDGVAEFMYKSLLKDSTVKRVISISLVLYVTFYGFAFLAGVVDFGRKELMTRLLKFGLVVFFISPTSWEYYNSFVVQFFKGGMDSLVKIVTGIFESNIDPSLSTLYLANDETSTSVHKKFIFIDTIVRDLISKPNMNRIFGLLFTPGTEFLSILYIPVILALIVYLIYAVLDITIKYLINLIKICFGLALGPVFILFSLFEKTKDMFKNWLSFMSARAFEIVLLFAILHPFLMIIDREFKTMLDFRVCFEEMKGDFYPFTIPVSSPVGSRTVFQWAEYFLKIGALIFVMKSVADKAGYISGQLISIGGVSNADAITEKGHGESGFSLAGGIAKGMMGAAKSVISSKYVGGVAKYAGRLGISAATKIGRAKFGTDRSLNERINDGFKAVGIRFRGARSLMRDAKIDQAINEASSKADSEGLKGEDREKFIRKETASAMNLYNYNNKNNSTLLGIDSVNIQKRLDEKLIKQPMKEMIRQKGLELKEKGIIGKEAQDIIRNDIEKWSKENLSTTSQKKVSEFFKKSSIKHLMKTESTLSGGQAAIITESMISAGKFDEAKDFAEKYRGEMTKTAINQDVKKQETLESGGKSAKFVRTALNTAFFIPGNILRMLVKGGMLSYDTIKKPTRLAKNAKKFYEVAKNPMHLKDHHWNESSAGQKLNKILGTIENKGTDARRWAKSFKIPFLNEGGAKSNPHKALRKFDRKMARMLSRETDMKNGATMDEVREKFGFQDEQKLTRISKLGVAGEIGKIRADDSVLTMAGKILVSPVTKPINSLTKMIMNRKGEDSKKIKEFREENKLNTIRNVANAMINDQNGATNQFKNIFEEDLIKSQQRIDSKSKADERFERTSKKEESRKAKMALEETLKKLDKRSKKDKDKESADRTLFEKMTEEGRLKFQKDMKKQMKAREDDYKKEKDKLEEKIKSEVNEARNALDDKRKLEKDQIDIIDKNLERIENYQKLEDNKKQLTELNEKLKSATDEEKKSIEAQKAELEKKIKDGEKYGGDLLEANKTHTKDELNFIVQEAVSELINKKEKSENEIKDLEEKFNNTIQEGHHKKEQLKIDLFKDLDYLSGAILKTQNEISEDIYLGRQLAQNIYNDFDKYVINTASSGGSASDSLTTAIPSSNQQNESDNSSTKNLSDEILANFIEATKIKRENSAGFGPEESKPDNDSTGSSGGEGKKSNLDTPPQRPLPPTPSAPPPLDDN